ncbi:hypothetical protein ACTI_23160 [Actinoplanes sp. OR16]|uniref:hypothetical protein n=1 Tax=Actinoplanes sp. OR16 TaxID=946334 RepID=UPI000F6FA0A2|nr:hypothetical protein [Actinoplanes sp. OR16]BBH65631.1 hypothetical protein ACTI_23160 [Actinoplanes sp. OR16]
MRLIEDDLRAALRAEAVRHRPDRDAMLDRITQTAMRNQFARHRKASPRLRISGAAVAVAAVLGGGGFAQWALAGDGTPPPAPPAPSVSVSVTPSDAPSSPSASASPSDLPSTATSTSPPARRPRSAPASPSSPPSSAPGVAPADTPRDTTTSGPLWSDGSIDASGAQGTGVVTVKTTEKLTALDVTIRVTRTPELVSRGGSQQVPGASVTSTVTEEPDALLYRFVLSSGDVLEPGTYVFYARYTYAEGGRDAGGDTYAATAATEQGETATVTGAFG